MNTRLCILIAMSVLSVANSQAQSPVVDFSRDVRPILSNHCFACHGPDSAHREAGLRLDDPKSAFAELDSGDFAIRPGNAKESSLVERVLSDSDDIMPPTDFNKPLSSKQKATLEKWILQGAPFSKHWSFEAPKKYELPETLTTEKVAGPIDNYVLAKAEAARIEVNDQADRRALIRRATLDLTGLPPTHAEIDAFLADTSPDAYEHLLDRLLRSRRFGEHQARYWLDLVRYGDTHGLHLDNYREMWPYRDWVIDAFNDNKPFNEFITEQLAGDLFENATLQQQIASGFNRLNVTTSEGGSIYDEVFVRNNVDRVTAFGTIFLGMTTGCATCHDHKFDPISMKDFYSLFAYFNSLDGRALDGNKKDHPPTIRVPSEENRSQIASLSDELAELEQEMEGDLLGVDEAQSRWELRLATNKPIDWVPLMPDRVNFESDAKFNILDDGSIKLDGDAAATDTVTIEAPVPVGNDWQLLHLEAIAKDDTNAAGASSNGNAVLSEIEIEIASPLTNHRWLPVKLIYAEADYEQSDGKFAIGYAFDGKIDSDSGWAIGGHEKKGTRSAWFVASSFLTDGEDSRLRIKLQFQSQWTAHQFGHVRLSVSDAVPRPAKEQELVVSDWYQIGPFTAEYYDAAYYRQFASEGKAFKVDEKYLIEGREYGWTEKEYADAIAHDVPTAGEVPSAVLLHRTITAKSPQKVTLLLGTQDGYILYHNRKKIGDVRDERSLTPLRNEHEVNLKKGVNHILLKVVSHGGRASRFAFAVRSPSAPLPKSIQRIATIESGERSAEERASIKSYYRRVASIDPDWLILRTQKDGIMDQMNSIRESVPTTLVWKELSSPRKSHLLIRGEYDQKGGEVPRAVPAFLPSLPENAPNDRMGLAHWLTDPSHPLTSRVAVNRFWQQLFGAGIVKTSDDFGAQGEPPSHPKLLDYLAIEFQESGWNVKYLIKQIMMSHTYRRDTTVSKSQLEIDPENRLLARGSRFRLDAEVLRDQALFVSGLLVEEIGGPSVKPPQPEGLWAAVGYTNSDTARFKADTGDKIYRRSCYTFWKRTSSPPTMAMFDAPSRESCTARRERTNTPLQALAMLNETQFVECARKLAERSIAQAEDDVKRIAWMFEALTSREPTATESKELQQLLSDSLASFNEAPEAASRLIKVGASTTSTSIEPVQLAAWTIVASTVLNLDEVVSK